MRIEACTLKLTKEEVKKNLFMSNNDKTSFYNLLYKFLEQDGAKVKTLDCTKLLVSTNIEETWFHDIPEKTGQDAAQVATALLLYGPKKDDSLPDNTVVIKDGCITYEEENEDDEEENKDDEKESEKGKKHYYLFHYFFNDKDSGSLKVMTNEQLDIDDIDACVNTALIHNLISEEYASNIDEIEELSENEAKEMNFTNQEIDTEDLKRAIFANGYDAIADFCGSDIADKYDDKDVLDGIMDDIISQMPDEELKAFYEKYTM